MRGTSGLFRFTAGVALTALLWDAALPPAALAQPAPPNAAQPDQNQGDPPARVGRVASITGSVSFHNPGDTDWTAATVNYPVTSGNSFWTEPSAISVLEVSDSRIALAGATELTINTLDQSGLQAVASQGEVYFHLRDLAPNETWSIETPRGTLRITAAGRYDIVVGTTDQPTLITVLEGSAQIDAPGVALTVNANQTATLTGTDPFQGSIGPAIRTAFLTARLQAERPRPAPAVAIPQPVYEMAGGIDLVETGSWAETPDYGRVWYPPVQAGWVPYREGHWAYVAPWGWTWVDNAPWGFAPFHYGRWVQIGPRWAWTPGVVTVAAARPVYAPALVTFIGLAAGAAVGAALASGPVGWIPLGPREPYHPWYHASPAYVREINVRHVTNVKTINNITINNYVNRAAATSVPAAALVESRPIQAMARPIPPRQFAAARPIFGQQPIRPAATTFGVTPVVARQLNLAPAPAVHAAPGPVIRAQAPVIPGRPESRPPLPTPSGHPAAAPATNVPGAVVRPGEPNRPGAPPRPTEPNRPGAVPAQVPAAAAHPGNAPAIAPVRPVAPAETGRPAGGPGAPANRAEAVPNRPGAAHVPSVPERPAVVPGHPGPEPRAGNAGRPSFEARPEPGLRPAQAAHPAAEPHPVPAPRLVPPVRPVPEARPAPEPHMVPAARPAPEPHAPPRPVAGEPARPERGPERRPGQP